MRIDAYNQVNMVYKATGKPAVKRTARLSKAEDSLELSRTGQEYQIAKNAVAEAPDVREDRVAEVKAKYESGKYEVSAEQLAAKLAEKYNTTLF